MRGRPRSVRPSWCSTRSATVTSCGRSGAARRARGSRYPSQSWRRKSGLLTASPVVTEQTLWLLQCADLPQRSPPTPEPPTKAPGFHFGFVSSCQTTFGWKFSASRVECRVRHFVLLVEAPSCWSVFPARSFRGSGGLHSFPQSFPILKKQGWKSSLRPVPVPKLATLTPTTRPRAQRSRLIVLKCSLRLTSFSRCCATAPTMRPVRPTFHYYVAARC